MQNLCQIRPVKCTIQLLDNIYPILDLAFITSLNVTFESVKSKGNVKLKFGKSTFLGESRIGSKLSGPIVSDHL